MSRVSRLFRKKDGPKSKEAYQSNDSEKAHPSKLDQYYTIPELTTQEEDRMISHLAEAIVSYGMDVPAVALLTVERPVSTILSQTLGVMVAPFAELIGVRGYDYVALFNKKENVNRLIAKIEELREKTQEQESKRAREGEKNQSGQTTRTFRGRFASLFHLLGRMDDSIDRQSYPPRIAPRKK